MIFSFLITLLKLLTKLQTLYPLCKIHLFSFYLTAFIKRKSKKDLNSAISIFSAHNLFYACGYVINRQAAENILNIKHQSSLMMLKFYYWLGACDFILSKY